jgi:esterase/lipase
VVVITSTGDPLFPYSYIQQVFKMIVSPKKEMMVFDEPFHLIFNECVDRIIDPIADKLRQYC